MLGTLVSSVAGAWSAMPGAVIDQWPRWVVLSVPAAIFALGLFGSYVQQNGLED
ncbi:hypothetical protein F4827_004510 [Paraburkholderia bannensis]|uniref:MFS transporter n=1 Tax=Paraburkholderia bannensis TaxID=765414 RepID=A0A7W9WUS4_9BURK|nr:MULTISPECIES: hypothetical protein [Paraburkholderia]MBB3259635.1 hypothetical protein [Paraburkholderia sp. WP4_3_2]MBB6104651.1 hypothetical protein [Paraburkholderia bannensis]